MSSELAIGIFGIIIASTIGAVQIWQDRKRRGAGNSPPVSVTAQPLREEAVTAIMDAVLTVEQLEGIDARAFVQTEGLEKLNARERELIKLKSRLRIAWGVSDEEVEAFTEVTWTVSALVESVASLQEGLADSMSDSATTEEVETERDELRRCRRDFQIAFKRFEEVARQAAAR